MVGIGSVSYGLGELIGTGGHTVMLDPVEQQWAYELQDIVLAHIELSDYLKHG